MTYFVDPNFDTYALDSCARYGIISSDPCLYLKGHPSPYLADYYPPNYQNYYKPDSFTPQNPKKKTSWKSIALGLLGLAVGIGLVCKHPDKAKKLVPQKVKEFTAKHTPEPLKKAWGTCIDFCKTNLEKLSKKK